MLALWRDAFARRAPVLMAALPAALVLTAAAGYHFTTTNPFNPLQLQNPVTWQPQIWNIAGYYAALLPFFFLAGLFISLSFVRYADRIGRVYAFDLTGAGAGAASVLAAMYVVHAFDLVPLLLIPLALAAVFIARSAPFRRPFCAALLALAAAEAVLLLDNEADYNDFKAIYAPLHTPDAKIVAAVNTPRGDYAVLDDFTERVDTDISNNAGMLGVDGPPRSYGLYRDGNRIAALPKQQADPVGLCGRRPRRAAIPADPACPGAAGRRVRRLSHRRGAARWAPRRSRVLEPEPELSRIMRHGLGPVAANGPARRMCTSSRRDPWPAAATAAPSTSSTCPPISSTRRRPTPRPSAARRSSPTCVSWRRTGWCRSRSRSAISRSTPCACCPPFAPRCWRPASTIRAAHVIVYRSAWNVRILISRDGWTPRGSPRSRKFCDDRSFDVSWYPGLDVAQARGGIYNDLPAVSFDKGEVDGGRPDDAIADEAQAVLAGQPSPSREQFNLSPITLDRPFFYAVLRLDHIGTILKRLEILPQSEVGALVNLAVLAQAVVIAALVLLVPLAAPGRIQRAAGRADARSGVFPGAGAGISVHRDLPDRKSQLLARRPDQRLRAGADRDAGVLRPRQPAVGAVGRRPRQVMALAAAGGAGLVRRGPAVRCSR